MNGNLDKGVNSSGWMTQLFCAVNLFFVATAWLPSLLLVIY